MQKLMAIIVLLACSATSFADGGWYYQKYWNGYCWAYRKVYYPAQQQVQKETSTTVVNNLIGIPVPVQYTQPIAQQGTTVYGYSNLQDTGYSNLDMGLLYNQAARLTDQAQQLAGQAAADFQGLVQAEGQNRAEVAKIIAQGQAAAQALTAAKGPPAQLINRSFTFRVTQDSSGQMKVEKIESGPDFSMATIKNSPADISSVIKNRCISCHGDKKAEGGLNFLTAISDEQQRKCLTRIVTPDMGKRMPKGSQLSVDEINAFFQAMGAQQQQPAAQK